MLERSIIRFVSWFIKPLGYVVVRADRIETAFGGLYLAPDFKDGTYTVDIKVDFKA